uniref:Uncharacterized protein n=1 Tax=Strongyloides venezuelensis TaxID=75913 RepID=A0A0K0FPZ5_STRVS
MLYILWFNLLIISNTVTLGKGKACREENIYQYSKNYSTPDLIFYGLTSDCQIFFSTLLNIDKIHDLKVDHKHQHCSPHYTRLHLVNYLGQLSVLVTTLRHGNNFCTMNIEFPAIEFITSPFLFTYSLMSSLPFFACSSLPLDSGFLLQPSQSYIDPRISDVIHFVGKNSTSKEIIELQFKITPEGYLVRHKQTRATNIFEKRQQRVLVAVDRRTGLLYSIGDTESMNLLGTCSLDPHTLPFGQNQLESNVYSLADKYSKVDSLSVDEKTIMLGIQKSRDVQKTRLLIGHLKERINFKCFISLPYLAQVSMVSKRTIDKLNEGQILTLEMELKEKQKELELKMVEEKLSHLNKTVKIGRPEERERKNNHSDNKNIIIESNDIKVPLATIFPIPISTTTTHSVTTQGTIINNQEEKNNKINLGKKENDDKDITSEMEEELNNKIKLLENTNDEVKDLFKEEKNHKEEIPEFDSTNETVPYEGTIEYFDNNNGVKEPHDLPTDGPNIFDGSITSDDNSDNNNHHYHKLKDSLIPTTSKNNASLISNNSSPSNLMGVVKNHFISFFITFPLISLTLHFTII